MKVTKDGECIPSRLAPFGRSVRTGAYPPAFQLKGDELVDSVNAVTASGDGSDVVFEAVGHPSAFEQAIELSRNAGTVIEVGHYAANGEASIDPSQVVHKDLDLLDSLAYPPVQFETAISLLDETRDGRPYTELFDYQVGFDDVEAAYEKQESGEVYSATIHPGR